jgi:hypothetical protein
VKTAITLPSALVLILGLAAVSRAQDAASPAPAPMPVPVQKWEFKMVDSSGEMGLGPANAAGKEGWELVAVQEGFKFLKRPLR